MSGKPVSIHQDQGESVTIIDIANTEAHQGLHWSTSAYQNGGSAMNVLVTAPAAMIYHFVAEIATTGPGTVTFSRSPDFDATGSSAIVAFNNNENSLNTSLLQHRLGGIWASSGTIMQTWLIGSASGNAGQPIHLGGSAALGREWTLAYDSVHLIRFVPTATCETCIRLYYYRGGEV